MPSETFLASFYAGYYASSTSLTTFDGAQRLADHLLRSLPRSTLPSGRLATEATRSRVRILDFGGGDGSIALAVATGLQTRALAAGAEIVVADSHVTVASESPEVVIRRVSLEDLEPEARFDLVLASAVLEHVPGFGVTLGRLLQLLVPGGVFYARTPWMCPWQRLARRLDLGFPAHLHDIGGDCWNQLAVLHRSTVATVYSRPSVAHVSWRSPLLAAAIHATKLPGHLEARLRPGRLPWWKLAGGWEVVWRRVGELAS